MRKIWTFQHEPESIDDMILSEDMKVRLKTLIKEKPNFILSGPPGCGKGTFMNIFMKETGLLSTRDFLKMNASDTNSVDDVRYTIRNFATTMGVGDFKLVYLNEGDRLSTSAQETLRDLVEQVQAFTRFAFVVNYPNKIIAPIFSRCQHIQFTGAPTKEIFLKCRDILEAEGISCCEKEEKEHIVKIIKHFYPDIRRIINALQGSIVDGKINCKSTISGNKVIEEIFDFMLAKDLDSIRQHLRANVIDYVELYQYFFSNVDRLTGKAAGILLIGEYLYRHSNVALPEINFLTMCVQFITQKVV